MSGEYKKPLPKPDSLAQPFWDHAAAGRLSIQKCEACGDLHFPPSPVCPACLSENQSWQVVSGNGVLESWIDMHRAYWPGFSEDLPYRVCIVRLDEGPLLVSNLVGPSENAKLSARVRVVFDKATSGVTLPKFALQD